jgi:hypothetical protein
MANKQDLVRIVTEPSPVAVIKGAGVKHCILSGEKTVK